MVRLLRRFPSNDGDGGTVTNRIRVEKKSILSVFAATGIGLAATAASTSASAQGVTQLEGITIYSANRTPTDAAKVGSSVEVLTEEDLKKEQKTYLKDYLARIPGVSFTQSGGPGQTTTMNIRGAYQRYVKVLVDGIDMTDPTNTTTAAHFEHLLVGDVSRIEVLKGSQSTLYGGDAVGGVITVETKRPKKPGFFQDGGAEYGAFNTFRGAYSAGYASSDGSNISFTVQGVDTDGFSAASSGTEKDGYRNFTFSSRGEYRVNESISLFYSARSIDAKFDFDDGFGPPPDFLVGDSLADGNIEQNAGRVGAQVDLLGGRFQNTFAVQGMEIRRESNSSFPGWFDGDRIKGEYKGLLLINDRLSLLGGAEWERTGATTSSFLGRETADQFGTYAQLSMEPIEGLMLTAGGRVDDHSAFGEFNTYRLTAAYLLAGTGTKLRASTGTGFRVPSLSELYSPGSGNPNLTPEESESWDVGIEQSLLQDRLRLSATYFELDTDNMIGFLSSPPFTSINVPGLTHREGVELSAQAVIAPGLSVSAGYTLVDSETPAGKPLVRVPKHNVVLAVDAEPLDKVSLNITANLIGDLVDSPQSDPIALDDYVLLSAKLGYEFTPGWIAYVRGENLLDEDYVTVRGYNTAGLSVYGGLTMTLPTD